MPCLKLQTACKESSSNGQQLMDFAIGLIDEQ